MPAPITEWDGTQNFSQIETIQDTTIQLLNNETIDELADAMVADTTKGLVGRGTISTDANTDFWILYGCQISGSNPGSRTVTAGAILYQNQVYHVSAKTVTTTGSQIVYWQIKSNGSNVHETKELEIIAGTSGGGIKNEGDSTIYRYGDWIESASPSTGLALSFTSNTTVTFTTDNYYYRYRRIGNSLEINFKVTASITAGASSVTKIFVPLPNGFTKKAPSGTNYLCYGSGSYNKPTSTTDACELEIRDYDGGSEGNKLILIRKSNNTGQIIMDNAGTITLRGNITIQIQ